MPHLISDCGLRIVTRHQPRAPHHYFIFVLIRASLNAGHPPPAAYVPGVNDQSTRAPLFQAHSLSRSDHPEQVVPKKWDYNGSITRSGDTLLVLAGCLTALNDGSMRWKQNKVSGSNCSPMPRWTSSTCAAHHSRLTSRAAYTCASTSSATIFAEVTRRSRFWPDCAACQYRSRAPGPRNKPAIAMRPH